MTQRSTPGTPRPAVPVSGTAGRWRRFASNVLAYFATIPVAYLAAMMYETPPRFSEWGVAPLAYVFTSPSWPLLVAFLPLLILAGRLTEAWGTAWQRSILVVTGMGAALAIAAWVFRDIAWAAIFAVGGLLYGAVFRVRPARAHRTPQ